MKIYLLLLLWAVIPVSAQSVKCPEKEEGRSLVGATMFLGDPASKAELQGDPKEIKGGFETTHRFNPGEDRWLVCYYKDDIRVAEALQSRKKRTQCKVREVSKDGSIEASAVCH
jgi:hypothetical protein